MREPNDQCPPMPVKATPYQHQREAFAFACRMFGLCEGGEEDAEDAGERP